MDALQTASEQLHAQLDPIREEAGELRKRLAALEADESKLEAAIQALNGQGKRSGRSGGKASRPSAKKSDVEAVCRALLDDNGSLAVEELEELAKHQLTDELGFSLSGFARTFRTCLDTEAFEQVVDGAISLAGRPVAAAVCRVVDNEDGPSKVD